MKRRHLEQIATDKTKNDQDQAVALVVGNAFPTDKKISSNRVSGRSLAYYPRSRNNGRIIPLKTGETTQLENTCPSYMTRGWLEWRILSRPGQILLNIAPPFPTPAVVSIAVPLSYCVYRVKFHLPHQSFLAAPILRHTR